MAEEKLLDQRVDLIIVNRSYQRYSFALGLVASRSYALLLSGVWSFGKKPIPSVHWPTALRRPLRELKCRTARSGAGSQARTGTSNRPCASSGVRIVGSKYSVVKAVPTLNAMASPKASRR